MKHKRYLALRWSLTAAILVAGMLILMADPTAEADSIVSAGTTEPDQTSAPTTGTTVDEAALIAFYDALSESETTTTTTPTPTTTQAPAKPQAPSCSTFGSQQEADDWMAANSGSHDTSNIDTDGDGRACTLHFAPPPPPPAADPGGPATYGSGGCGGGLPPCYVMMRESGGDITAQNPTSTASGKWQFLDSTWGGYGGYAKARYAPESVQDDRARQLWAGGAGCSHWSAC